jgi:hypothetical protein
MSKGAIRDLIEYVRVELRDTGGGNAALDDRAEIVTMAHLAIDEFYALESADKELVALCKPIGEALSRWYPDVGTALEYRWPKCQARYRGAIKRLVEYLLFTSTPYDADAPVYVHPGWALAKARAAELELGILVDRAKQLADLKAAIREAQF